MKLLTTFIVLICFSFNVQSQIDIQGSVIDSETKEPIPYVNIGVQQKAIGTVSNDNGVYQLEVKDEEDIITFSSIGYEVVDFSVKELRAMNIIELVATKYNLGEVEIVSQKIDGEEKILGVKNKNRGLSIGFGSRQLGTEIGALIRIKKPTFIKSANFVLNHATGDSLLFRVNIYDYQNKKIGDKMLKENVFIAAKQKKGTISVDLSTYDLILENDVLLTLEWIKDDEGQGNTEITFDTKKSRKLKGVHIKQSSLGTFKKLSHVNSRLKPCFYFIGNS